MSTTKPRDPMWGESLCAGSWLHEFALLRQSADCAEEVCIKCHTRMFWKIRHGVVDNYRYLYSHLRSALQPYHRLFRHEYPDITPYENR